jgi:Spy/CpxP family protein refolding chaperone
MKNWKSILLLILVFFAGLAVGVVGTRIVVRRVVQTAINHPERVQSLMERNLTRKLNLDNSQQVKLHDVLTDARGQLTDLRKEFQPQAATILTNADQKISALLTPEQQARYEKFKDRNWPALRRLREGGS